jgi:hypothetical protein
VEQRIFQRWREVLQRVVFIIMSCALETVHIDHNSQALGVGMFSSVVQHNDDEVFRVD